MLLVRRHGGDDFLLWWQGCRLHMCRSQPTPLPLQLQREINGEFWKRGSFRSGSNTGAGKGGDRADKIARCPPRRVNFMMLGFVIDSIVVLSRASRHVDDAKIPN